VGGRSLRLLGPWTVDWDASGSLHHHGVRGRYMRRPVVRSAWWLKRGGRAGHRTVWFRKGRSWCSGGGGRRKGGGRCWGWGGSCGEWVWWGA